MIDNDELSYYDCSIKTISFQYEKHDIRVLLNDPSRSISTDTPKSRRIFMHLA